MSVGERIRVSLPDGDEEDEVTRVVVRSTTAGVWLVETTCHGRVIIFGSADGSERGNHERRSN